MTAAALALVALVALLATVGARRLADARWPARAPQSALVLWQAMGLAAGWSALGAGLVVATDPLPGRVPAGVLLLGEEALHGRVPVGFGLAQALGLAVTLGVGGRLLWVLTASVGSTLASRRRHRTLVDLLGTPWPTLGGARVLDHPGAVAYCLPGLRPRVVLSAGTLALLTPEEVTAVLAHEQAHLRQRHDLVVLPFVALGATFPRLPGVAVAQEQVAVLVEMLADGRAARSSGAGVLAGALARVGSAGVPGSALAVTGSPVTARVRRLLDPPPPAGPWLRLGVHAASVALLATPVLLVALG